jgi:hypothetical protein
MSTPVSLPVIPAQPNLLAYGVADLALFASYTRDTYLAAFGIQAPAWDSTRVGKSWFDSTANISSPSNVSIYNIISPNATGTWAVEQMVMPASEAATVNLPGSITYPVYVVAPTDATVGGQPFNPDYLSTQSDALALMATVGGSGLVQESFSAMFPTVYPVDEPRRLWDFTFKATLVNAGALLLSQNAAGVGSPGHWDLSGSEPLWVPDPPAPNGLDETSPARPVPVRDLLPNEELQTGLMGVSIIRTDLQNQQNQQAGEFTPDDRATLQQIYQMVSKL